MGVLYITSQADCRWPLRNLHANVLQHHSSDWHKRVFAAAFQLLTLFQLKCKSHF